jgi:hypothetical protein
MIAIMKILTPPEIKQENTISWDGMWCSLVEVCQCSTFQRYGLPPSLASEKKIPARSK